MHAQIQHAYSPVAAYSTITQYIGLPTKLIAASTLCRNSRFGEGGPSAAFVLVAPINMHKLGLFSLLYIKMQNMIVEVQSMHIRAQLEQHNNNIICIKYKAESALLHRLIARIKACSYIKVILTIYHSLEPVLQKGVFKGVPFHFVFIIKAGHSKS